MLFSSSIFLYYFLPVVLFVYFILLPKDIRYKNAFLLLASLCFYAWGEPVFVLVMIASILANYVFGILVDKYSAYKTGIIILMLVFNLSLIFIFKYLMFFCNTLNIIFLSHISIPYIELPIGISFFTFQSISYVIDISRGKGTVQRNPLNVGLYIALFPQLIAGPIVRYETIAKELKERYVSMDDFTAGVERFIIGLSKKMLLANNMAIIADHVFNIAWDNMTLPLAWLGAIAYTLQIYFDFSGYSDMAIGLGRMFGFHFLENFNFPYVSRSISEFWRRWHISLGTWFRDYVYIPLGGSRVGLPRLYVNLFVVWTLTGLWHGANWTFVIWGILYFVLLTFEKTVDFEKCDHFDILKHIYVLLFVIIGWILFRSDSITDALCYINVMFSIDQATLSPLFVMYISEYRYWLLACIMFSLPMVSTLYNNYVRPKALLNSLAMLFLLLLSMTYMAKGSYNPFIYFNF